MIPLANFKTQPFSMAASANPDQRHAKSKLILRRSKKRSWKISSRSHPTAKMRAIRTVLARSVRNRILVKLMQLL